MHVNESEQPNLSDDAEQFWHSLFLVSGVGSAMAAFGIFACPPGKLRIISGVAFCVLSLACTISAKLVKSLAKRRELALAQHDVLRHAKVRDDTDIDD